MSHAENDSKPQITGYPSIDKPWLKYYSEEAINASIPECSVYRNVYVHNKDHLNAFAMEYFGTKITYGKLFDQVERCAKALKAGGVSQGDVIAAVVSWLPEAVYLMLAASKIGAMVNFVNPLFDTQQKIDRINDTGAKYMFVMDAMYSYIVDAVEQTCISQVIIIPATNSLPAVLRSLAALKGKKDAALKSALTESKYIIWRDFLKAGSTYTGFTEVPYQKDMPMVMVYSSGTTGASKGIVLTNDGFNATIAQYECADLGIKRGLTFLSIVPIWFSTGIIVCFLVPLCLGMKCVLEPVFGPEPFTKAMLRYKPNSTLAASSIWLDLINKAKKEKLDLSYILMPGTGGELLLSQTEATINNLLASCGTSAKMQKGWGMCELGATAATSSELHNKLGSVGYPLPLVTISAFDPDSDEEMPCGERGELRVITPSRMLEYHHNTEATAEFFRKGKDGQVWACSGDMGYIDEDGDVFVLGRMSDYFISESGKKIYLFDIENVILQDSAVEHCEVVDIIRNGKSVPVAHIILKDASKAEGTAAVRRIHETCEKALPLEALPDAYKLRDGFAVKPSGKRDTEALKWEHDGFVDFCGNCMSI